ncbi:response regulator transcription factor [Lacrimispora aerotolerans]|jgi:DNA-binding NarL/FixJ family response regulator|uniref:response regulator transcription factor n=1 Tax=Lacrimispora aerotolerans TaxID=36832 RepID=UPI000478D9C3|nr:response regulator transcription factor [Lacrimispora aerotolerans]
MSGKIKIVIADDQELIRDSLKIVLSANPDMEVIDTVADGREVICSVRNAKPDIILMDVRMPGMDGVSCSQIIKENYPQIKLIILTTFDDDEYVYNALKYGASGYLLKGVSMAELSAAIRTVHSGKAMINPDIAAKVVRLFSQMAKSNYAINVSKGNVGEISRSEWKIIQQVGYGKSNKEIALNLNLSEGTVRNGLSSILSKLDLRDRTQLAIWAVQTGVTTRNLEEC